MTITLDFIGNWASILSLVVALLIAGRVYNVRFFSKKSYQDIEQKIEGNGNQQHIGDNK